MPFRFPSWAWTLNPLIRQTDASNNQPGSSNAVGNNPTRQVAGNAINNLYLLGFPPGTTVTAARPHLVDATRRHLLSIVQARRQRRPFRDELGRLNLADDPVDSNDLPVMTRDQFQTWWDNQDQLVFTTLLRTQEHHLLSTLTLTDQLIDAEQNVQDLIEQADSAFDRVDELERELDYAIRTLAHERRTWQSKKTAMKLYHNDELEIERKKITKLEMQIAAMDSLQEQLKRCTDQLAEQDEVNSNGELLYPMLVVLDRLLNRADNERPSARQLNVQTRGNKRDGDDSSGELPPKSHRKDKKE